MVFSVLIWMDDGDPCLGIMDASTGQLRQWWRLQKLPCVDFEECVPLCHRGAVDAKGQVIDLQHLIQRLFLIGCLCDMRRSSRGAPREDPPESDGDCLARWQEARSKFLEHVTCSSVSTCSAWPEGTF